MGRYGVVVPRRGLRRLPLVRPHSDQEFRREPFQIAIDQPHQLDAAGADYVARCAVAAAELAAPPPPPRPSDADIAAELSELGVDTYATTVASRFPGWDTSDQKPDSISIATDGPEASGVGGAGAVSCTIPCTRRSTAARCKLLEDLERCRRTVRNCSDSTPL